MRRIFAWQRRVARAMGIIDGRCAAITFIQRGGGALNSNVHFHTIASDGVFDVRDDGSVRFVPICGPSDEEVFAICDQVARRVLRLVNEDDDRGDDTDDALTPTRPLAFAPGPASAPRATWEHPEKRASSRGPRCVSIDGFSLHAQTTVSALDRAGLERLCRYGLRSSFALSRLSLRDDGRLSYRLKRPWSDGRTELVLEPLEFLRRLAHMIPPARSHLVRYHGAFAPASPIRKAIRPRVLRPSAERCCSLSSPSPKADARETQGVHASEATSPVTQELKPATDLSQNDPELLLTMLGDPPDEASLLPVRQRRLDWASLLRRTFKFDVLSCSRCGGRLEVLAAINDPEGVQKILRHLDLPTEGPRCAPARAPPEPEFAFDAADDFDADIIN
jgi:hypothetical protein